MNNVKTNTATATVQPEYVKRIGNSTYRVKVHFSQTSKETISDKVLRLIRNEVRQSPKM
jgi:hypothetical protein